MQPRTHTAFQGIPLTREPLNRDHDSVDILQQRLPVWKCPVCFTVAIVGAFRTLHTNRSQKDPIHLHS